MNFSNNPNFYPTPKHLIEEMLKPYFIPEPEGEFNKNQYRKWLRDRYDFHYKNIMEPSGGSGAILDYLSDELSIPNKHLSTIEIDPELISILRDKGYKVVDNNFLEFESRIKYDLFIMNPPFDTGDQHVLKAWELVIPGGHVIALVNAETVRNPYSKTRQQLCNIIGEHGTIEYKFNAFSDAQRKTDVSVAIIRLQKPDDKDFTNYLNSSNYETIKKPEINSEIYTNQVVLKDEIGNIELMIARSMDAFVEYTKAYNKLQFYTKPMFDSEYFNIQDYLKGLSGDDMTKYNDVAEYLNARAWNIAMSNFEFKSYMTSHVYKNFDKFMKSQGSMVFNKKNVLELIEMLFINRFAILDETINELFDYFTEYHKDNRMNVEGWKTNSAWKVNKKIILPYVVEWDTKYMSPDSIKTYGARMKISYDHSKQFYDIDKVMCYITGQRAENITGLVWSLDRRFNSLGNIKTGDKIDNECESTFFKIKFWRKGTIHITFKDEKVWQEFNMRACANKNWLPENEKAEWMKTRKQPEPAITQLLLN